MAKTYPMKTGITNFDDCVYFLEEKIEESSGSVLPAVSSTDNGKVLMVSSGKWAKKNITFPTELPENPTEDGTYLLQCVVADGTTTLSWAAQES